MQITPKMALVTAGLALASSQAVGDLPPNFNMATTAPSYFTNETLPEADRVNRRPVAVRLAGLLLMSALVGCAALQVEQQQRDLARAVTECDAAFPAQVGNYVARAKCFNTALDQIVRPITRYPDRMNVDLIEALNVSISTKADREEISPEYGNLQLQIAYSQIMDAVRAEAASRKGTARESLFAR